MPDWGVQRDHGVLADVAENLRHANPPIATKLQAEVVVLVDIATGRMATDGAIPDDRTLQSLRHGPPALPSHVGGLTPEQCDVLAALRDGARMWQQWPEGERGVPPCDPPQVVPSLRKIVNVTGFMYYFLGLERRAKKCLWIRLVWCLGVRTRMKESATEVLTCDAWIVEWATGSPVISSAKPVRVVEFDHDDEFRYLGYTTPLTDRPRTAKKSLTALTRRAARVFATKPNLRDCGVSIVASALVPKNVYHFAFGKATVAAVEETERGYGGIIRQSLGVARGFPWNVLAGSLEYDVRRPGSAPACHGGDEDAAAPVSVDDQQLGLRRL